MKIEHIYKILSAVVCRVYKGSVRFNTIATSFKKLSRKNYPFNTRRPTINAHGTFVERIYFVKLSNSTLLQRATLCLRVFTKMKLNCKYKFCNEIILNFVFIIQILHKLVYYYF